MATVIVQCVSCGDQTIFIDGTSQDDHIEKTASGPDKYLCHSCGARTDDGPDRFRVS